VHRGEVRQKLCGVMTRNVRSKSALEREMVLCGYHAATSSSRVVVSSMLVSRNEAVNFLSSTLRRRQSPSRYRKRFKASAVPLSQRSTAQQSRCCFSGLHPVCNAPPHKVMSRSSGYTLSMTMLVMKGPVRWSCAGAARRGSRHDRRGLISLVCGPSKILPDCRLQATG
jgi:hypothetical protein